MGWELPFDASLAFATDVHGVFDLGHFGDQIGGFEEGPGGVAACDDNVLVAGTGSESVDHFGDIYPAPPQG